MHAASHVCSFCVLSAAALRLLRCAGAARAGEHERRVRARRLVPHAQQRLTVRTRVRRKHNARSCASHLRADVSRAPGGGGAASWRLRAAGPPRTTQRCSARRGSRARRLRCAGGAPPRLRRAAASSAASCRAPRRREHAAQRTQPRTMRCDEHSSCVACMQRRIHASSLARTDDVFRVRIGLASRPAHARRHKLPKRAHAQRHALQSLTHSPLSPPLSARSLLQRDSTRTPPQQHSAAQAPPAAARAHTHTPPRSQRRAPLRGGARRRRHRHNPQQR
jgi:hypothetical protein